jgi:hypothetical protein
MNTEKITLGNISTYAQYLQDRKKKKLTQAECTAVT